MRPAIDNDNGRKLTLWAESPDEARVFMRRVKRAGVNVKVEQIFVAKRSGKARGNAYLRGEYYPATCDEHVDVFDEVVLAPREICELVEWCTCDIMLSWGASPILVFEDTTHLVRMNLYQRFPRLARGSLAGVPAVMLQGTRGIDLALKGDRWALFRYLQAYEAVARVHPASPAFPFWYIPSDESRVELEALSFVEACVLGDRLKIEADKIKVVAALKNAMRNGVDGAVAPPLPSIEFSSTTEVIVNVGAQPQRPSWRTKGSGQMDAYLGMILAAKYIYCFDAAGQKTKDLVLRFRYLPPDFWFFANPDSTALYKRLPIEFADRVEFLG